MDTSLGKAGPRACFHLAMKNIAPDHLVMLGQVRSITGRLVRIHAYRTSGQEGLVVGVEQSGYELTNSYRVEESYVFFKLGNFSEPNAALHQQMQLILFTLEYFRSIAQAPSRQTGSTWSTWRIRKSTIPIKPKQSVQLRVCWPTRTAGTARLKLINLFISSITLKTRWT